ncbi:3120_t:CDS:1, partial [Funneliformis geosporum]
SDEANLSAFIAVDRTIHPTDDLLAKWHLSSIFNNRFELPEF